MKSNKEKVYDFIRLHADEKADRGISTAYIADAMELQRTNVSSILNLLVQEGRIQKCNGRPVLYKVGREESTLEECFSDLIGADGSLRQTIQLAKAAVLYPQRSLNTLLVLLENIFLLLKVAVARMSSTDAPNCTSYLPVAVCHSDSASLNDAKS